MKKIKEISKKLIQDESAQGATEYILLLIVVVAIAMMFRERITEAVRGKLSDLSNSIGSFSGGGN